MQNKVVLVEEKIIPAHYIDSCCGCEWRVYQGVAYERKEFCSQPDALKSQNTKTRIICSGFPEWCPIAIPMSNRRNNRLRAFAESGLIDGLCPHTKENNHETVFDLAKPK